MTLEDIKNMKLHTIRFYSRW